jgi:hypothetical protein
VREAGQCDVGTHVVFLVHGGLVSVVDRGVSGERQAMRDGERDIVDVRMIRVAAVVVVVDRL